MRGGKDPCLFPVLQRATPLPPINICRVFNIENRDFTSLNLYHVTDLRINSTQIYIVVFIKDYNTSAF